MMAQYVNQMILDNGIRPPKTGRASLRVKHCKGLYLEVSASGNMAWKAMYRVGGKQIKETHDFVPVDEAVTWARSLHDRARERRNPLAERRAEEERAAVNTVTVAVERYLAQCERDLKPKTVAGYRQIFEHDILPRWRDRPLASIMRSDVLELLNDKAAKRDRKRRGAPEGAAVQANRVLTRLRTLCGWSIANGLIAVDPTVGVRKPAKEAPGDRVLNDAELRAFWAATAGIDARRRDAVSIGALFRVMLLTGQREGEVAGMRRAEIDAAKRQWVIPGARTKNGKEHVVHLGDVTMEVLPADDDRDLVFSATGKMPAVGFARAKARLDEAMLRELCEVDEGAVLPPFVLHDLRRTATSLMARIGIEPHICDRCLNHVAGTIRGVAATYNRFTYLDERRLALEALGRFVDMLARRHVPGHVAEARVKLWLRTERERGEREAAGNVADLPLAARESA
jgi:integrase